MLWVDLDDNIPRRPVAVIRIIMSYQVLARKYRPQVFAEVLGQEPITQTLVNAIVANRMAHAILFTGPRGTGKTSIARILAKSLNCEKGPTPVPCNLCRSCEEITRGHSADVFEIDGASNNSVDQVRDLRENAIYRPSLGMYKIYIIDEVHMLSTAAFNALLKILEEPPSHVIFIFATTEVHKLPATILSRCQRHDLGRVPLPVLVAHLQNLCDSEKFSIAPEALECIAREADGSVRDSLSLLDRILSVFPDGATDIDLVMESLGVADQKIMQDLSFAVLHQNGAQVMALIEKIDNAGLDLKKFYDQILSHFRDMYIMKIVGPGHRAVNGTQARKQVLADLVEPFEPEYLSMLVDLLLQQESLIRFSAYTRIALETIFLKMIRIRHNANLDRIIQQLDQLVDKMGQGGSIFSGTEEVPPLSVSEADSSRSAVAASQTQDAVFFHESSSSVITQPHEQEDSSVDNGKKDAEVVQKPESYTWQDFLHKMQTSVPFLAAMFSEADVDANDKDKILVTIGGCSDLHRKRLDNKTKELQQMCKDMLGKGLEIQITAKASPEIQVAKIPSRVDMDSHPLVKDAQEIFHGTIVY